MMYANEIFHALVLKWLKGLRKFTFLFLIVLSFYIYSENDFYVEIYQVLKNVGMYFYIITVILSFLHYGAFLR